MTDEQWRAIVKRLTLRWPRGWPQDQQEVIEIFALWRSDLNDLDPDQVLAVIETIYRDGREWPPSSAQIRARVVELMLDIPTWAEALRHLSRCVNKPTRDWLSAESMTDEECQAHPFAYKSKSSVGRELWAIDRRAEALEATPAGIKAFVAAIGWVQIEDGLWGGGSDEARLREKYTAWSTRTHRDITYVGIEPAGLPALERGPTSIGELVEATTKQLGQQVTTTRSTR